MFLGNGVISSVRGLEDVCLTRLDKRGEDFESNPTRYVNEVSRVLNLEGHGSVLKSEFCGKGPEVLFGVLDETFETENDSKSMSNLILQ